MKTLFAWNPEHPTRLLLLLTLLVYLAGAGWRLGGSDAMDPAELKSLLPAQETWLRNQDAESGIPPSMRGEPYIRKPPMLIRLNLLVWSGLNPDTATPGDLAVRARWVAWGLGLVGLGATFWIGATLYRPVTGARAALILASAVSVLRHTRMATYDTHLLGWVTLAVAASLAFGRRRTDWDLWVFFLAGSIASVCAFLTKGAAAAAYMLPPLLVVALLTDSIRIKYLRLFTPFGVGIAAYGFWLVLVLTSVPEAAEILAEETLQTRQGAQSVVYYLIVFGLVFPWTLLWLGQLTRLRRVSWREAAPWLILLAAVVVLSLPDNRRQRYLIPLLPWFAIGCSHFWETRRPARLAVRVSSAVHVAVLTGLSLALVVLLPNQDLWVARGWIPEPELPGAGWGAAVVLGLWTLPLSAAMLLSVTRHRTRFLVPLTALWMGGVYAFAMHFYVDSYHGVYPHREATRRLTRDTLRSHTFLAAAPDREWTPPEDGFLFHTGRFFRPVPLDHPFGPDARVLVPAGHADAVPEAWEHLGDYPGRNPYTLWKPETRDPSVQ